MPRRVSIHDGVNVDHGNGSDVVRHILARRHKASLRPGEQRGAMKTITLKRGMPFGELKELLTQIGFHQVRKSDRLVAYAEDLTGALVLFPDYQEADEVRTHHLNTLKVLLVEKGLVECVEAVGLDR